MKIRRFAAMAMASMMVLSMAACGGSSNTEAPATEADQAEATETEEVDNPMSEYELLSEADAPVVYSNNSFRDALCNFLGPKALEKITFVDNSDSEDW